MHPDEHPELRCGHTLQEQKQWDAVKENKKQTVQKLLGCAGAAGDAVEAGKSAKQARSTQQSTP